MLSRDASPAPTITTEGIVTDSMEYHNTPLTEITAGRATAFGSTASETRRSTHD